jgi:hypothetical protein
MTDDTGYFQLEVGSSIRGLSACQGDDEYQIDIKSMETDSEIIPLGASCVSDRKTCAF